MATVLRDWTRWRSVTVLCYAVPALCLLTAGCENGVTEISSLQKGRQEIDCSKSYLAVDMPGAFKCDKLDANSSSNMPGRGIFQTFNLFGTAADGMAVSLQERQATSDYGYLTGLSDNVAGSIQNYNNWTRTAHDWTVLVTLRNAYVMKFVSEANQKCIGFLSLGPPRSAGWKNFARGYMCSAPGGGDFSDAQVAELLAKVKVLERPVSF